jgi:hypothetical protein
MRARLSSDSRRALLIVMVALAASFLPAAAADAAGYPTRLSKRTIHAAEPQIALQGAGHAYIKLLAKTNAHGQIVQLFVLNVEKIPVTCAKGGNRTLGTESFVGNEIKPTIHPSGAFEGGLTLMDSDLTLKVSGKFTAHGTRVSGQATLSSGTPEFEAGFSSGCRLTTGAMNFSASLKWHKFG